MPTGYRQFREDALVRKCVILRATWATKAGFETVLVPKEKFLDKEGKPDKKAEETFLAGFQPLKEYIDRCNRTVNADFKWRNMLMRAKLQGKAVQQIVYADKSEKGQAIGDPKMLVPLRSDLVRPKTAPDWTFKGVSYRGRGTVDTPAYTADELLYFINEDLDEDKEGLSDVEPIMWAIEARQRILQDDLPEAVTALWCASILWRLDRSKLPPGTTDADVKKILQDHVAAMAKPAKQSATTTQFENPVVVDMKPDLDKLVNVKHEVDFEIIRNFGVPRFLVGYEQEVNKATAGEVIKAWIDGPVKDDQMWLRRNIEAQWYTPLVNRWLTKNQKMEQDQDPPVRVHHQWRRLTYVDFLELMNTVTVAHGNEKWITDKKCFEVMQNGETTEFPPEEVLSPV